MNLPLAPPQVPYFATYSAINQSLSGNAASQVSSQKEEVNLNPAYVNNALLPPDGTTSWYTYFQTLIKKNYTGTYLTFNPNGSNTISSHLGVTSNNGTILVAQAPANTDIVIPANTICDEATVILIDGKLTLYPNFTIGGTVNKNGCIFIASGDILIGNTIQSNVPLGSTASAQYESVFAQFVTDKEFATYRGYFNPQYPNKGVGLYLNGGVIANQVTLQRDLNYTGNSGQPAHIFEFDPKYRELFRDVFAITKYSIREVTN